METEEGERRKIEGEGVRCRSRCEMEGGREEEERKEYGRTKRDG